MTVIYLFVSPSGRAYAGRHTCDPEGWPRRGSGALPSGYRGSGKLWANVTRRHGPAIGWIILRRFGPDAARADIDAAERRAIRLVRHLWKDRCVNRADGGDGNTSSYIRALWRDPDYAAKTRDAQRERGAAMKAHAKTQSGREALARAWIANRALMQTPEGAASLARARSLAHTPEAKAKAAATRARNKALREAAE